MSDSRWLAGFWRRGGRLSRLLAAVAAIGAGPASALCLTAPPPDLRALQQRVWVNPKAALAATHRRLDATSDIRTRAWLHAIEATAYSALELNDAERAAAAKGLALPLAANDPARLELLVQRAASFATAAEIDGGIAAVEAARRLQPGGSIADICARSAVGLLYHSLDRPERATAFLLAAYRATTRPGLESARAAIASNFSAVLKRAGDLDAALALNAEEVAYATANGLTYAQANAQYFRGQMLAARRDWPGARAAFAADRALAERLADEQGVAYAEMGLCHARLELDEISAAERSCAAAAAAFAGVNSKSDKRIKLLRARIALARRQPGVATRLLDDVLDDDGIASASPDVTEAFGTRATANAALGRFAAAYADLRRHVERRTAANEAARDRETATMRARFRFDDQERRNEGLARELRFADERERQQRTRVAIILTGLGVVIVLLSYIVTTERKHRRALLRLADADPLTGLPNRRRIGDIAAAAIDDAARRDEPLTIALLDLDNFKAVNDRFGHGGGDEVLSAFAATARAMLRRADAIGRWGGEEFLLVLPATGADAAHAVIERLRDAARALRLPISADLRIAFSAGMTTGTKGRRLGEMILAADTALYAAKAAGRDCTLAA